MFEPLYNQKTHLYLIDNDRAFCQALIGDLKPHNLFIKQFVAVKHFVSWIDYEQIPLKTCVLCEADLPEMSGLDLLRIFKADSIHLPTVLMSHHPSIRLVVETMSLGATYFLEKSRPQTEFVQLISQLLNQTENLNDEEFQDIKLRFSSLSQRQKQILNYVFKGEKNKKIAHKLNISIKTVELHRALMMKKMQANSLSELIQMAVLIDQTNNHPMP